MKSGRPSEQSVMDALGDKVLAALASATFASRADLTEYRQLRPAWVAEHSNRGLLNWISDRLWTHITRLLDDVPNVDFVEAGPTREMYVDGRYRFRFKKHDEEGLIRSYPTQTALDFLVQEQGVLEGMEQVRLCAGFIWDGATREIGPAVLSLRDGGKVEDIIWVHYLDEDAHGASGSASVEPILPTTEPSAPQITPPAASFGDEEATSP